jgi:hypothetical protein
MDGRLSLVRLVVKNLLPEKPGHCRIISTAVLWGIPEYISDKLPDIAKLTPHFHRTLQLHQERNYSD